MVALNYLFLSKQTPFSLFPWRSSPNCNLNSHAEKQSREEKRKGRKRKQGGNEDEKNSDVVLEDKETPSHLILVNSAPNFTLSLSLSFLK